MSRLARKPDTELKSSYFVDLRSESRDLRKIERGSIIS